MASVEAALKALIESELMDDETAGGHLSAWRGQSGAESNAGDDFFQWLMDQNLLTGFQGSALIAGHTGPFMVGPYRVHEQIASSRGGVLYRAVHVEFDQPVSLKIIQTSPDDDERTQTLVARELRISSIVDHSHVVRSFQVGRLGDVFYLALEDLQGATLAERLESDGRFPFKRACRVIRDVAKGLVYLHENGVIHRNLRPENIWLGDDGVAKIMEFGTAVDALASQFGEDIATEHDDDYDSGGAGLIDKYDYMPAEQAYDECCADQLSDIYSLGCTLYHCLTGRPPFNVHHPIKKVLRHVFDDPEPVSKVVEGVPHQIDETITGMLAKQYEDRFQKAEEVVWALNQYLHDDEEAEQVDVVRVSPQYLEWIHGGTSSPGESLAEDAVGATPELSHFLKFVAGREK